MRQYGADEAEAPEDPSLSHPGRGTRATPRVPARRNARRPLYAAAFSTRSFATYDAIPRMRLRRTTKKRRQ